MLLVGSCISGKHYPPKSDPRVRKLGYDGVYMADSFADEAANSLCIQMHSSEYHLHISLLLLPHTIAVEIVCIRHAYQCAVTSGYQDEVMIMDTSPVMDTCKIITATNNIAISSQ